MPRADSQKKIIIVDDDETVLGSISALLHTVSDYEVKTFVSGNDALEFISNNDADLVISDYIMPEMDGISFFIKVRDVLPEVPRIMLTGYADKENVIKAINSAGLFYYIEKPWNNDDLLVVIRNGLEKKELVTELRTALEEVEQLKNRLQEENLYLQEEIRTEHNFKEIVGESEILKSVLRKIELVVSTDTTVLILGETGTGKELIARAVHNFSNRKDRPLVKVNCASLPANLIESELFGHEKGAFTGAVNQKVGRFELADGGTIFLDEIGDMPKELQVKLLRVLQEGEFERVGGHTTIKADVRVIAATNRDLEQAMKHSDFREDLFYRLNVYPVNCPPLRERKEDIGLLVRHFINKFEVKMGKKIESIPPQVIINLEDYHWPGNVRELENIIERAMIVSTGTELELSEWLPKTDISLSSPEFTTLDEYEKKYILEVLNLTDWRVSGEQGAAKILGMNPTTLEARMKKLDIRRT